MDSTLRTLLAEQTWKARYHLHEVMCSDVTIETAVPARAIRNCRN